MADIIKKYQAEGEQRISAARKITGNNDKMSFEGFILNPEVSGRIQPGELSCIKPPDSVFKAVSRDQINREVKEYNLRNKEVMRPQDESQTSLVSDISSTNKLLNEIQELRNENRRLKEELERIRQS